MAAKAGYIDSGVVERVLQNWIAATFPQEAAEQQAEAQAQAETQEELPPEVQAQMLNGQAKPQRGRALTQAATESLMRGMTPAL